MDGAYSVHCATGVLIKKLIQNLKIWDLPEGLIVICYLTTAMYYSYGQRLSPSVCLDDRLYDGHMITGEECGPDFLSFVLRLRENGKISTRKLILPEIEPGLAA